MFYRKIINYFLKWKEKKERKPLIVRGARQVGKTCAVLLFGKKYFKEVIHINLDNIEHLRLFRKDISLKEFEDIIKVKFNKKIIPNQSLIFIDEIQNAPSLIKLLRFFYEEKKDWYVIAAGSLLEAKIRREGLSFPVGRVEFCYLYPLDFFEYLEAKKEKELLDFLLNVKIKDKIPEGIHKLALEKFYEYTLVGGMPEVVKSFIRNNNMNDLKSIYNSLFTTYCEDVYKYSSLAEAKYLSYVIETAPLFAGNLITYEKFGGSNFRSREMSKSFDTLEKVMLLYQLNAIKSRRLPLVAQKKRPKKLIFLDVGLVNYQMGLQDQLLHIEKLDDFYRGRIAEQVVAQNLISQYIDVFPKIFYWAKEKKEGSAEVDFCFSKEGKIVGIEVKSKPIGRLKSLFIFAKEVENSVILRIYSGNLEKSKVEFLGEKFNLISLPFYLVPRVSEILKTT